QCGLNVVGRMQPVELLLFRYSTYEPLKLRFCTQQLTGDCIMTIWGYARESTNKQELGLKAQVAELRKSGCDTIIEDAGSSGATNLIDSEKWKLIIEHIEDGDTLRVWSQSRLGRESYEVQFVVGRLVKRGIAVEVLEEGHTFNDLVDFGQNSRLALLSLTDHHERVEIKKRTKKALDLLKENGVRLGSAPKLSDADVAQVRVLRDKGLGLASIAKVLEVS